MSEQDQTPIYNRGYIDARLRLIQYLISAADQQGKTHGEKHYYLKVAQMELVAVMHYIGDSKSWGIRLDNPTPEDVSEIPF